MKTKADKHQVPKIRLMCQEVGVAEYMKALHMPEDEYPLVLSHVLTEGGHLISGIDWIDNKRYKEYDVKTSHRYCVRHPLEKTYFESESTEGRWAEDEIDESWVAIVCGGGPGVRNPKIYEAINEFQKRDDVVVIGCSESINHINLDYYMACHETDKGPERLNTTSTEGTTLIRRISSHPDYYKGRKWKSIIEYCHEQDKNKTGEPFLSFDTVLYDCIQLAVKWAKCKHMILVGCEHAAPYLQGYHEGQEKFDPVMMVFQGLDGKVWQVDQAYKSIGDVIQAQIGLTIETGTVTWNCSGGGLMLKNCINLPIDIVLEQMELHYARPK